MIADNNGKSKGNSHDNDKTSIKAESEDKKTPITPKCSFSRENINTVDEEGGEASVDSQRSDHNNTRTVAGNEESDQQPPERPQGKYHVQPWPVEPLQCQHHVQPWPVETLHDAVLRYVRTVLEASSQAREHLALEGRLDVAEDKGKERGLEDEAETASEAREEVRGEKISIKSKLIVAREKFFSFFKNIYIWFVSTTLAELVVFLYFLLIVVTYFYPESVFYSIFDYTIILCDILLEIFLIVLVKIFFIFLIFVWWFITLPYFPIVLFTVLLGIFSKNYKNLNIIFLYIILVIFVITAMFRLPKVYYQF